MDTNQTTFPSVTMSSNEPEGYNLEVVLDIQLVETVGETKPSRPAVLTVAHSKTRIPHRLLLQITDGKEHIYQLELSDEEVQKDLKVGGSSQLESSAIDSVLTIFHRADPSSPDHARSIKISYTLVTLEGVDSIRLEATETLSNKVVRKPWQAILKRRHDATSVLVLVQQMAQALREGQDRIRKAQEERALVERGIKDWKFTVEQLEQGQQGERTELLRNFLTLYRAKQDQTKRLQEELDLVKAELRIHEEADGDTGRVRATGGQRAPPEDLPEDVDAFDEDLVEKLATGKRVNTKARNDKKEDEGNKRRGRKPKQAPQPAKRKRNQKKTAGSDSSDTDAEPRVAKRQNARTQLASASDQDSGDENKKAARKPTKDILSDGSHSEPLKQETTTVKKVKKDFKNLDSDSDTDDEFVATRASSGATKPAVQDDSSATEAEENTPRQPSCPTAKPSKPDDVLSSDSDESNQGTLGKATSRPNPAIQPLSSDSDD